MVQYLNRVNCLPIILLSLKKFNKKGYLIVALAQVLFFLGISHKVLHFLNHNINRLLHKNHYFLLVNQNNKSTFFKCKIRLLNFCSSKRTTSFKNKWWSRWLNAWSRLIAKMLIYRLKTDSFYIKMFAFNINSKDTNSFTNNNRSSPMEIKGQYYPHPLKASIRCQWCRWVKST